MGSTKQQVDDASEVAGWLEGLSGTWSGEETISPSPWTAGGTAEGRHRFRLDVGGLIVVQDYRQLVDGSEKLSGHGVFAVDGETDAVLWYWFDSYGYPPLAPATGTLDGKTLTLSKTTVRGSQRATFSLDGPALHHRIEFRPPGAEEFGLVMTSKLDRES